MPSDLPFRNRFNPAQGQIDSDGNDPDNPEYPSVVGAVITENNTKNDTTKIARCTSGARDDT